MKIELTDAEAIVLSDLLYRISEKDEYYEDIAEQYVLWDKFIFMRDSNQNLEVVLSG